jgi:uncharacterized protein YbbC (DUF1343 family)
MGEDPAGVPAMKRAVFLLVLALSLGGSAFSQQRVRVGADVLAGERLSLLKGRRVALACNQTSVLSNGVHLLDTLLRSGINVVMLFSPEHGIRGTLPPGAKVENTTDPRTGIPVYSLYGGTRKPPPDVLERLDLIVFDMQDVGARFYTYASTMAYIMEAAAEQGKPVIVLDRPNPINGVTTEGPVLDLRLISFLGLFPVPVRHGLTIGELAAMIAGEGYINPSTVQLTVIPMEGWKRPMWFDDTKLPWVPPSPNMKTLATATVYPGTCLFEATNISEGRGTPKPFEYIGAPGLRNGELAARLNALRLAGAKFSPVEFTPTPDSLTGGTLKFQNQRCRGVWLQVTDRKLFQPVLTAILMLAEIQRLYPKKLQIKSGLLDRLLGDERISQSLEARTAGKGILRQFARDNGRFLDIRKKYLLY